MACTVSSQNDVSRVGGEISVFEKIMDGVRDYKPDTSAVPLDKMTRKIIQLRKLRGGFNINEVILFKLEESRQKKEIGEDEFNRLNLFYTSGNGKRWVDNAVIHIYRNQYTNRELRQMVRFYKTAGGRKMAEKFPVVLLESAAAAEEVKQIYHKQNKEK
ncbi:MAG TPA: DUF2059 domain-containing protein [Bacteroidia bacterium]|jgi:hypothetical protein|nr:DUF2059 domain-containing protein [Bacteroidia bacterium]